MLILVLKCLDVVTIFVFILVLKCSNAAGILNFSAQVFKCVDSAMVERPLRVREVAASITDRAVAKAHENGSSQLPCLVQKRGVDLRALKFNYTKEFISDTGAIDVGFYRNQYNRFWRYPFNQYHKQLLS